MGDKPSKEDWRDAIASTVMDQARAANFAPPDPIGYDVNLPQVTVQHLSPGAPRMGAMFDMGNYSLEGSYQPRDQRPEYSARLTYRKQF